ncbi:hypothetical protein RE6C_00788 [Rhodopirellula europaea 6C]|uniref:Uncharacterized protein n=1 Tax=Rhodopirellula europaea 6C TaxID=1263867 RepID=M2B8J8_9BACT|nr:hypothetical protein RE6C_00788 [Rhodopirellula europaea 6C]
MESRRCGTAFREACRNSFTKRKKAKRLTESSGTPFAYSSTKVASSNWL